MAKPSFIPSKLPPKIEYEKLVEDIGRAHASLGRLDALIARLPNPKLLSRALVTKEAVMSSQIEGTQATLSEVFEQEAMGIAGEETKKEKDVREIANYRLALEKGIGLLEKRPISENLIKELHRILLHSTRGHNKTPGEFRKIQVYLARPGLSIEQASFVPPPPMQVPELFGDLERYINAEKEKDPLVQIAVAHYQFEAIHPFMDGNGRIGRLLISLMLYEKKLLSHPFIYLSEFFEEHRPDYYELLRGVSEKGAWEDWIAFFLRGIDVQARKTQETSRRIIDLHARLKEDVRALNSIFAYDFLDAMFTSPIFSSKTIRKGARVKNTQTLFSLIKKFEKAGIIQEVFPGRKRNKIYKFTQLLDIVRR